MPIDISLAESDRPAAREHALGLVRQFGIVIAFILLCIILSFLSPYFLKPNNLLNVLRQISINSILAFGMTLVILTRGIDLSVGSILAFAGVVSASLATRLNGHHPSPAWLALIAGISVGSLAGALNGLAVTRLAVPPFVATLGMYSVARGLTYIFCHGQPIPSLSPDFTAIGTGAIVGIPIPVIIFLAVFALLWLALTRTTYGRYVYAVGGNEKSAWTAGISTKLITLSTYVISGLLAGLAGIILTARVGSGLPQAGVSYELDAIAAVVIGGVSLSGGVGSIFGTLFGALILGVISNGLDLLHVDSYWQLVIKGSIIVGAVLLDPKRKPSF